MSSVSLRLILFAFFFLYLCVCVFIFLFYVSFFLSIAVCSLYFLPLITPVVSLGLVLQHSIDKIAALSCCIPQFLTAVSLYLLAPFFYPGPSTVVEPSPHSRHLLQLCGHGSKSVSLSVGRRNWRQVSRVFLRKCHCQLKELLRDILSQMCSCDEFTTFLFLKETNMWSFVFLVFFLAFLSGRFHYFSEDGYDTDGPRPFEVSVLLS